MLYGTGSPNEGRLRLVGPDSRRRYPYDPWHGLWGDTAERLRRLPATIIFKSRKARPVAEGACGQT